VQSNHEQVTADVNVGSERSLKSLWYSTYQYFSTGVQRNFRLPRVTTRGSTETDQKFSIVSFMLNINATFYLFALLKR